MFAVKSTFDHFFRQLLDSRSIKLTNDSVIQKLMRVFQADEYSHQANKETADLGYGWIHYGFVRQQKPKNILCIGSGYGFIPSVLAQACKDNGFGHVYFIDAAYKAPHPKAWGGNGFWRTHAGQSIFTQFKLENFITLLVTTTKEFAKKYSHLTFDYIYIDADHSYEGVKFDYQTFWPKLTSKGLMLFHDVSVKEQRPEGKYGVYRLWRELTRKSKHTFSIDYIGSGLGMIQK